MASSNTTDTTPETIEVITHRIQVQSNPIFLQTTACQAIAGLFVWTAVFVTCQQVKYIYKKYLDWVYIFGKKYSDYIIIMLCSHND